jgi:hypothetical protein
LSWDRVDDPRLDTYELHHGPASRAYKRSVITTKPSAVVSGLQAGELRYFAVRACASDAVTCSGFSNEVSVQTSDLTPAVADLSVSARSGTASLTAPVADFSVSAPSGTAPFTTVFSDHSSGEVSTREWDLGDGTSTDGATVVHTYRVAGTFPVTLKVTGPSGSATETELVEVTKPAGSTVPRPTVAVEAGKVQIDHDWRWVSLRASFADPIVVAKPLSANDRDPSVVRVSDVAPGGFWIRVQEWDYLDGRHRTETVSYLVMERGRHEIADGVWVEAGRLESGPAGNPATVVFASPFAEVPAVFAGITSIRDPAAATSRLDAIDRLGFTVKLQAQQASNTQPSTERVDYIAWPPSAGEMNGQRFEVARIAAQITDVPYTLPAGSRFTEQAALLADIQTTRGEDPVAMRWRSTREGELDLWIEEEGSSDAEMPPFPEEAAYLLMEAL